ncbi:MAG: ASPIC/UnbV domain-containing protein, partial [Planctomycetota bacterium]
DLYLSNDRGHLGPLFRPNQLWRNDDGALVNVSEESGAGVALYSMGVACGDFDGNRWPDLYLTNIPLGGGYANNLLLLNQGNGTFEEAAPALGVSYPCCVAWGALFFDYDNDTRFDLYVNGMFGDNAFFVRRPQGGFPCVDIAREIGMTGTPWTGATSGVSFCAAVADIDGDGDLDVLENNLGSNVQLYVNGEGHTRHAVRYRVIGEAPNHAAVGASLDTLTGDTWHLREIMAGGHGYLGQNELIVHVGLDACDVVDELMVRWPASGATRRLSGLPANHLWTIYPPGRLGDADGDEAWTFGDYEVLAGCYGAPVVPGCEMMDLDGDSVIGDDDAIAFFDRYGDPVSDCDHSGQPDLLQLLLQPELDEDGSGMLDSCEAGGDLDGDGEVTIDDLLRLLLAWGPCPFPCPEDLDGDGAVDVDDLIALLINYG